MDIPVVTAEQEKRFEAEFVEYQRAYAETYPDSTPSPSEVWRQARAYSEMQIANLLGTVEG